MGNKVTYVSVREKPWVDLQDNRYEYKKGDVYPRKGLKPTKERIEELSGTENRLNEILIMKKEDFENLEKSKENSETSQDE